MKLYMLEELDEIKAIVVAKNINEAMMQFQAYVDGENAELDYTQGLHLIGGNGRADWQIEVYENFKPSDEQQVLTVDMLSTVYDVFEFDFVFGRVYGDV